MNLGQDMSIVALIQNASLVVQLVMLLLVVVSLMSWYYIFAKAIALKNAREASDRFEQEFWSGVDLNQLFERFNPKRASHLERIFEAGFREFVKLKQKGFDAKEIVDGSRRGMQATNQREMDEVESHLSFLATVGSVSPYVGLFGTVWGIMHAFRNLANVGQATLAAVAPGIAEALVATAIGLFAAIPAVVAYNQFVNQADRLSTRFDSFIEEFLNILQRQLRR